MANQISDAYEFGGCRLDVQRRVLTRDGAPVSLAPKTFELLLLLVQADGRALSKKQLMTALWPDTFVDEANLSFQISALRKGLGDGASHWIETIPKHGYRFSGDVIATPIEADDAVRFGATAVAGNHPIAKVAHRRYARRWIVAMAVLIVMVAALWGVLLTRSTEEFKAKVPPTIPLTTDPGSETTPSFSPDGTQVAFA
jgi:DNA-binding winged helix-turn-helix (wHTH) protein